MQKQAMLRYPYLGHIALVSVVAYLGFQHPINAQILPDSTLPTNSVVTQTESIYTITAGSSRGSNLFHSFEEFSVPNSSTVLFDNALTIEHIITRVTGNNRSSIEGLLQSNGNADLFLINPNGIVFGENARLDIGGSFIASTAEQIDFADGTSLSVRDPSASSLLTISTPIGLQYGSSPGDITILGTGNGLGFDADNFVLDRSQQTAGLTINNGETLALVGGNITLRGGNLAAPDGRIVLGSVAGSESIGLDELEVGWDFTYDTVTQFQDIRLARAASGDVSGTNGGNLHLQGQTLRLGGGSTVLATTLGSGSGGQTELNASERLIVTGFSTETDGSPILPSSVITGLETGATGTGGTMDITAPILRVVNGGAIASNNLGAGLSGDLTITASDRIRVDGGIPDLEFSGGLLADVYAEGNGGDLSIETNFLAVTGGGEISASTLGDGNSGRLDINANTVTVDFGAAGLGASSILTTVQPGAAGNANDLTIVTEQLFVSEGARILASTFGKGDGGNLVVSAQSIDLFGVSPGGIPGGLATDTEDSPGQGGDIIINTDRLSVSEGALIASFAVGGPGDGGNLMISAQTIDLLGTGAGNPSGLGTESNNGNGVGGNITINTNQLRLSRGAQISSTTSGNGDGGNIRISAQNIELRGNISRLTGILAAVNEGASGQGGNLTIEAQTLNVTNVAQIIVGTQGGGDGGTLDVDVGTIRLAGSDQTGRSGLFASAIVGTGEGGDIQVRGDRLTIEDGATISASNFPSNGDVSRAGDGGAGNIELDVRDIRLSNEGTITASTSMGGRGNITIQSDALFMTDLSQMTTNSQGQEPGGNINIDADLMVGLGNSDITANAQASRGGRIIINSDQIYGLVFRDRLTPGNDVTATSELGAEFNGVVQINNPDIDIAPGTLPEVVVVEERQLVVTCDPFVGNVLVEAGRGGLPTNPFQPIATPSIWQDWRFMEPSSTARLPQLPRAEGSLDSQVSGPTRSRELENAIPFQEAEQITKNESGTIALTRQSRETAHPTAFPPACQRNGNRPQS